MKEVVFSRLWCNL